MSTYVLGFDFGRDLSSTVAVIVVMNFALAGFADRGSVHQWLWHRCQHLKLTRKVRFLSEVT